MKLFDVVILKLSSLLPPRFLLRLVYGISGDEHSQLTSALSDIYRQIAVCCESLDNSDESAWVTQARELAYDMEDRASLPMLYYLAREGSFSSSSFFELFSDTAHKLRLRDIEARLKALTEGRPRSILDAPAVPRPMEDPRPTKLHLVNTKRLVGLDAAIHEVTRMVTDAGDSDGRKMVSIVGMPGSGKTTLAASVYQRLRQQNRFNFQAFVSVGQKPDLRSILKELLSQLVDEHYENGQIGQLAACVRIQLKKKRYLIVLDDLWRNDRDIMHYFPENNLGSRIITTTRNNEVAWLYSSGSRVHEIDLLSDADSKQLFLKQLETTGHACPPYWDRVSDQIMRRCAGLPLAVVSVADMLAHNPSRDEWEMLGLNLLSSSHMDGVKRVINLSYNNLNEDLKSCLLYLSIFPVNYEVEVKRLVRLYIVEKLISPNMDSYIWSKNQEIIDNQFTRANESANICLSDLIRINMVQSLHRKKNQGGSSRYYCRLHPVIHDFIFCKSKEENFVTRVDAQNQHDQIQIIRRLSLQRSNEQNDEAPNVTMNLSRVHSVTIFGQASATPCLTDLSLFVRVLDLDGCNGTVCLDGLTNLRLLEYLSLRGTDASELPATIGVLRFLEVLDVSYTKMKELPSSIGALRYLEYLSLRGTDVRKLPETIGKLRSLIRLDVKSTEARTKVPETICHCRKLGKLVTLDLSDHLPSFVQSLGHLRELTVIALTWSFHQCSDKAYRKALLSSISRWRCLTSLTIHCGLGCSMEFLGSLSDPPKKIEKFKVTAGRFARVPKWISGLDHLSFVQITVCNQGTEQLKILGDLPKLQRMILGLDFISEKPMVIERGWFPKLERFSVDCPKPWLSFNAGSMQMLSYLELKLCACPVSSVPSGIDYLQRIEEVSICYRSLEHGSPNISTIVRAMRKAVAEHTNRITLFINGTPQDYNAEAAEAEASSASGTEIGTDGGITYDIQRVDEEPVNATMGIQSTFEIEEIESED